LAVLLADQAGTVTKYSVSGANLGVFATRLISPAWISARYGHIYVSQYNTPGFVTRFSR
jgi:hypothetical protein